jgi:hypothetical protein
MGHLDRLTSAIAQYPEALASASVDEEIVEYMGIAEDGSEYPASHNPNDGKLERVRALASQAQDAYGSLSRMTNSLDLTWAEGPWLEEDTGRSQPKVYGRAVIADNMEAATAALEELAQSDLDNG